MRIVESSFFRACKNHLSDQELEGLDKEIDRIKEKPLLGVPRPKIRDDLYTHFYEDEWGKKILSYRYQNQKIRLVSIDRNTFKL